MVKPRRHGKIASISVQGEVLEIKCQCPRTGEHKGCRAPIRKFTGKASRAMYKKHKRIDFTKAGRVLMVALTYPGEVWPNPRIAKQHLRSLFKRMKRRFPNICWSWKMEAQDRGAPHFHLMVICDLDDSDVDLTVLFQEHWFAVVKRDLGDYFMQPPDVQTVANLDDATAYISKLSAYTAKTTDNGFCPPGYRVEVGRKPGGGAVWAALDNVPKLTGTPWEEVGGCWGMMGQAHIPYAVKFEASRGEDEPEYYPEWLKKLTRVARRHHLNIQRKRWRGLVAKNYGEKVAAEVGLKGFKVKKRAFRSPGVGFTIFTRNPSLWLECAELFANPNKTRGSGFKAWSQEMRIRGIDS